MEFVSKDETGKYAAYEGDYYHNGMLIGKTAVEEPPRKDGRFKVYVYDVYFNLKSASHSDVAVAHERAVQMIKQAAHEYIAFSIDSLNRILVKPAALAQELNLIPATIYAQAGKKLTSVELGATADKRGDTYIVRDLKLIDYVTNLRASARR